MGSSSERRPVMEAVVALCSIALVVQGLYIVRLRAREASTLHLHQDVVAHTIPSKGGAHNVKGHQQSVVGVVGDSIQLGVDVDADRGAVDRSEQLAVDDNGSSGSLPPSPPRRNSGPDNKIGKKKNSGARKDGQSGVKSSKRLRGKYDGAAELRIVFLHVRKTGGSTLWALLRKLLPVRFKDPCLCSIKSPPMYESRCQEEARNESSSSLFKSSSSTPSKQEKASLLLSQAFVEESDVEAIGGLDTVLRDVGYDDAWIARLSPHLREVLRKNIVASSQVFRALAAGCPVVELHHWDISVAALFKAHGYRIITIVREPLARLESSYNYEFISAEKNGDRQMELAGNEQLLAAEREQFRTWLLRQHAPQEALRMVSGCFLNSMDNFDVQLGAAAVRRPQNTADNNNNDNNNNNNNNNDNDDDVKSWLPQTRGKGGGDSSSSRYKLWASVVAHRTRIGRLDPQLCLLNPTFDDGDQDRFSQAAVEGVVQQAEAVVNWIDFVGIQERWGESVGLLARMFDIPSHLLDVTKKANARNHTLRITDVLSSAEQAQLHTQVAADTAFYGRLVKRFDRDIERWTT